MGRVGLGNRIGAAAFDAVIVGLVFFVLYLFLIPAPDQLFADKVRRAMSHAGSTDASGDFLRRQKMALYGGTLGLAYGLLDVLLAGTLGKKFLQLRITDPLGTPATFVRLILRYLIKYSALGLLLAYGLMPQETTPLLWGGAGAASVVLLESLACAGSSRQTIHDKIAGTAVTASEGVALPSLAG